MPHVKTQIDLSAERFGSEVTIAHLAANSFEGEDSDTLHVYRADQIIARDWPFEVEAIEMEYAVGIQVAFKDGSRLSVGCWGSCCREGDPKFGNCHWCGGRYFDAQPET